MSPRKPITIRKERFYPHPPEDVWVALTDPHALAEWFEPNDHDPVVGHEFQFRCDPNFCGSGQTDSTVLEADPPRRLVWSWVSVPTDPDEPRHEPMTIAWTLVAKDEGTLLVLEHSGAEHIGSMQRNLMRFGWGYMMKSLIPKVLANIDNASFTPGAIPLNKRAYKCETVPERYVR